MNNNNQNKFIIIIYGPTAAGKTDFALTLAHHMNIQIINMDMGQFYKPLSIGTAKPDWQQYATEHHLFDIIDEPKSITVTQYRQMVDKKIKDIWHAGDIPVLVGGSGFYLMSLLFPQVEQNLSINPISFETDNPQVLWNMLQSIDPERAAKIHYHDIYRIKRALAIWHATGKKPSEQFPVYNPIAPYILIHVTRDRAELYRAINQRLQYMMDVGWLEEVATLKQTDWESFLKTKKIIGYDDLLVYLNSEQTSENLTKIIAQIAKKTRNYAKRQETFWVMLQKNIYNALKKQSSLDSQSLPVITSFNLTLSSINLYIKQLLIFVALMNHRNNGS